MPNKNLMKIHENILNPVNFELVEVQTWTNNENGLRCHLEASPSWFLRQNTFRHTKEKFGYKIRDNMDGGYLV